MSILDRVNPKPKTLDEVLAQDDTQDDSDPRTCTLHALTVDLLSLDRAPFEHDELGDEDEREQRSKDRQAALARCIDDEERYELRRDHEREDAAAKRRITWRVGATARLLVSLSDGDCHWFEDGAEPRWSWWCPSCQRPICNRTIRGESEDEWPDQPPKQLVVEHRYGQALQRGRVWAACLGGCSAEQLAVGIRKFIVDYEALVEHRAQQAALTSLRDEFTPSDPRPVEWLGHVPARGLTLINGVSGSGKSWLLEALAVSCASGRALLGRDTPRGVVLLALLEAYDINLSRVEPLARGLGTSFESELRGKTLYVWPRAVPLKTDDGASLAKLGEFVRTYQPSMILIDNLTEIRSGTSQNSENDSTIMSNALRPLAQLAHDGVINGQPVTKNPPAVIVLHHDRGSTAIEQHADLVIEVTSKGQDAESPITLRVGHGSRVRPASLPLTMRFRGMLPEPIVPELVMPRERAAETPANSRDEAYLAAVRAEPGVSLRGVHRTVGGSLRDVGPMLRDMEARGLVEVRDGGWYAVDTKE